MINYISIKVLKFLPIYLKNKIFKEYNVISNKLKHPTQQELLHYIHKGISVQKLRISEDFHFLVFLTDPRNHPSIQNSSHNLLLHNNLSHFSFIKSPIENVLIVYFIFIKFLFHFLYLVNA